MQATDIKDWSKEILDLYAEGLFDIEVAAKMEIPIKEFHEQAQANPRFGRLVEYGRTLCEAFWVGQARKNLNNKTFVAAIWALVMKNQFNWAEKNEQASTDINPNMNADELRAKINKEWGALVKNHSPELTDARSAMGTTRE